MTLAITTAWHTANFSRRRKCLPSLKSVLRDIKPKKMLRRPQTAEEQIAIMKMIGAGLKAKKER